MLYVPINITIIYK